MGRTHNARNIDQPNTGPKCQPRERGFTGQTGHLSPDATTLGLPTLCTSPGPPVWGGSELSGVGVVSHNARKLLSRPVADIRSRAPFTGLAGPDRSFTAGDSNAPSPTYGHVPINSYWTDWALAAEALCRERHQRHYRPRRQHVAPRNLDRRIRTVVDNVVRRHQRRIHHAHPLAAGHLRNFEGK